MNLILKGYIDTGYDNGFGYIDTILLSPTMLLMSLVNMPAIETHMEQPQHSDSVLDCRSTGPVTDPVARA